MEILGRWQLVRDVSLSLFTAWLIVAPVLQRPVLAETFRSATPGYRFSFPRDHGAHEEFRTEWWYYTGHLTATNGRRLGYQITFFRRGIEQAAVRSNPSAWAIRNLYLAHFAVSDLSKQRFHYAEKISRAALGKAGAATGRLSVWIDRWAAELATDHERQQLTADGSDFSIQLTLTPQKPPVLHGKDGTSRKGSGPGDASHYYSMTRLATDGTVTLGAERLIVHGLTWMDHEFGSGDLADELVGWDWFSIQLDDGRDLMLYLLRRRDGTPHPASSGTVIFADGRAAPLELGDFSIEVLDHWTSPHSGGRYPSRWQLAVPTLALVLQIAPRLADQELRTPHSTQVTYWEGAVAIAAVGRGLVPAGHGYVELTGYTERLQQPR